MKAFKHCLSSVEAKPPPGTSGVGEFGNNDPTENFKKCDVRHAMLSIFSHWLWRHVQFLPTMNLISFVMCIK